MQPRRRFQSDSGIPLLPYYSPQDGGDQPPPGTYPFTRGVSETAYRDQLWHFDQYAGYGDVEESRDRYESLLEAGSSGINIALDLPTQVGLDSDAPEARGEVGKVGLAVDSLADLEQLFDKVSLGDAGIVFTVANAIGPLAMAWFIALSERQKVPLGDFVVHLQNDPIKEFTGRATFIFPLEPSVRMAADVVEYASQIGCDHWKPIGICGSQFRWGGGTAIQEIAFGIAAVECYVAELMSRGLNVDDFGPLLEMHLASDLDLFEEVAKFRAARQVYAEVMRDRFGAANPEAQKLRVSLYTAGHRLTAQEPLNNSVRVTIQALAAVLGGVQHVGTLSIDEALSTPNPDAALLALRTQQILAFEVKAGDSTDPLGGSYLVESLTETMADRMKEQLEEVRSKGGLLQAIRSGWIQEQIDEEAYVWQREVDSGERPVVGVNSFRVSQEHQTDYPAFMPSEEAEQRQIKKLVELRANRNNSAMERALDELSAAAERKENIMPMLLDAVREYATVGEVTSRLEAAVGSWRDEEGVLL